MRVAVVVTACTPSLFSQAPEPKTTVIRFYSPVTEQSVSQLLNTVDQKLKAGTKRFVLLISSPGGSVFAGLSAYHYLKGIPAEIITHNFGEVDSIATVIYCAGSSDIPSRREDF
jgi:ATP-dependent protease ClpP protease subunit